MASSELYYTNTVKLYLLLIFPFLFWNINMNSSYIHFLGVIFLLIIAHLFNTLLLSLSLWGEGVHYCSLLDIIKSSIIILFILVIYSAAAIQTFLLSRGINSLSRQAV